MSEDATLDEFIGDGEQVLSAEPQGVRLALGETYPEEWGFAKLGEICEVNSGFTWNKEQETDSSEDGAVPVIKIGNVQDGYLDLDDILYLTGVSNEDLRENKARKDWLLMIGSNGSGERVGHCGIIEEEMGFVYASFLYGLHADSEYLLPRFLFYSLNRSTVQQRLTSFTAGSTSLKNLNKTTIENLSIPTPPLSEQRKIANALYSIDQAIQKTEEIIKQTESSKQALMQSLFLNGYYEYDETIDAHHRNRLSQHPSEWTTKPAEKVINVTRGAHPRPKSDDSLWGGDIPIIKIGDRNRGDSRTITSTDDTVTEKGSKSSKLVDKGTLIVSNAGTVGAARITGMETCIHDHWLILRDYEEHLTTRYLYYFINWNQNFLEALASGSTVLDLNTDDFRLFDVTFPSLDEQQEITDALDSLHDQNMVNLQYADRLRRIKQGLMQDLLSGTVRTTDTNIQVPDEIAQHG